MDALFPAGLSGFDYAVILLVGLLTLLGLMRGFTHEALSLAGWIAAIVVVRFFHEPATMWAAPRTGGEASAAILMFLLLFFGTVLTARAIATAAGGMAKRSVVGPFDRLLGGGFGALKGVILASIIFLLVGFATSVFNADRSAPRWMAESRTTPLLMLASGLMVGWVKEADLAMPDMPGMPQMPDMPLLPGLPRPPGDMAPGDLPPGHPSLEEAFPPGHPMRGGAEGQGGYSAQDRQALDALLDEAAKAGEEVEI